ncbi:MAG: hypothetical protein ABSE49_09690 [Polyangiaceae bacterium]|jgi:hypothetical protein
MRREDVLAIAAMGVLAACHAPPRRDARAPVAACPRDARQDASGRCVCDRGDLPVLGACVPPAVADAYCGPAARATEGGGCVFRACDPSAVVDVDAGCISVGSLLHGGPRACDAGESLVVEEHRPVCIAADAACPRGTRAAGASCAYPPSCPAGSLVTGASCRPVVLRGDDGTPRVDLGAWAALALGNDGGPGSADLCRPLLAHPVALELGPADRLALRLHVVLSAPDGDVSRVSAEVRTTTAAGSTTGPAHPLAPAAATLAEASVATLLEPLRGLGGETTATRVEVEVRCELGARRRATPPPPP